MYLNSFEYVYVEIMIRLVGTILIIDSIGLILVVDILR